MDNLFMPAWSVLVRTAQSAIESSSTVLIGFLVAAIMRRMLGEAGTRRLFGGEGLGGLVRAWAIGSLLPVCSLGLIPVVREMRRAGVPSAVVLAFVLAAPQLNPLSFLYGLTLSDPLIIVVFVAGTMAIAIAGGELWKLVFETPGDSPASIDEPPTPPGIKRLLAVAVAAGRDIVGPSSVYIAIGVLTTGLITGLLPHGSLSLTMRHDSLVSPLLMTLIGVPAYSGVLPGMMRIGLMFEHGNSVGAAFVLFQIGVGLNLGLIVLLASFYGLKRIMAWGAIIIAVTLVFAYAAENPLYFAHEEASHTHAFDDWTSPFHHGARVDPSEAIKKIGERADILEQFALTFLSLLAVLGISVKLLDSRGVLENWLTKAPVPTATMSVLNRHVPGPVLGGIALAGLVVLSVVALFIYYPSTPDTFDMITRVRAEALTAVNAGKKEEAVRQLEQWDLLTRKLQVGVFLRSGHLDPEAAKVAEDLRELIEEMRDALIADDLEAARALISTVDAAHRECRDAFPR